MTTVVSTFAGSAPDQRQEQRPIMPMLRVNGTELYYEDTGGSGPAILFSHGLFWDSSLFAPQIVEKRNRGVQLRSANAQH